MSDLGPVELPQHREVRANEVVAVVRLAKLLWREMSLPVVDGEWERNAVAFLTSGISSSIARVLVVPADDGDDDVVACSVAVISQITPSSWLPNGKVGYLQWFYTVPEFRGRSIASRMIEDHLSWFRSQGVVRAQLHSADDAASLYVRHGFEPSYYSNYWIALDN